MCHQTVKIPTWDGGPLCKDANPLPLQTHAACQLPIFQAIGPHLSTTDPPLRSYILPLACDPIYKQKTTSAHRNSSRFDTTLSL